MRENFYHQNPKDDNDLCWGVDFWAVNAKHAVLFACPHGDCCWKFDDEVLCYKPELSTMEIYDFYKNVVGFILDGSNPSILTIRCPRCQRYMWVHNRLIMKPEDIAIFEIIGNYPNWPKSKT